MKKKKSVGRPKKTKSKKRQLANLALGRKRTRKRRNAKTVHDASSEKSNAGMFHIIFLLQVTNHNFLFVGEESGTGEVSVTRTGRTYSHVQDKSTQTPQKTYCDASTEILHGNNLTRAGVLTEGDARKDRAVLALDRLKKALPRGFHWTSTMIVVLLKIVFGMMVRVNWGWTASVGFAAALLNLDERNVFKFGNEYLDGTNILPEERQCKTRGRGSDKFKAGGADRYSELKERHLKMIVDYVHERNLTQRGMCTVKSVQAHLLTKTGIFFKEHVVWYALSKRLGFKYRTPLKRRIIFSPERTQLGIEFCRNLDTALKAERAGTGIVVYMDETYCHLHHLPGKMWYRDSDIDTERAERCRSKGSLQIILHALWKGGWMVLYDDAGNAPVLEEWHSGEAQSTEMVFRGKVAGGDYHANIDGDMFMMWINKRLVPTIQARFPDKKVYLVMDNAPYHHGRSDDCFFAAGKPKSVIQDKLTELGASHIDVKPYEQLPDASPQPAPDAPVSTMEGWVFFEKTTGEVYMVDGLSDEGLGNVVVHTRIGPKKFGAVVSAFEADFRRLLRDDFCLVGHGEAALLYVRQEMRVNGRLAVTNRNQARHIARLKRFIGRIRRTRWRYRVADVHKTYNGIGGKGTGGPKGELLRRAMDEYIKREHPHLRDTRVSMGLGLGLLANTHVTHS